jgi:hypothetical protein
MVFLPGPFRWSRLRDSRHQFVRVYGVASRAGGEDSNGRCVIAPGFARKFGDCFRSFGNGIRLQTMSLVEILAQACLAAFFNDRLNVTGAHVSHEQFNGIGANVYNGAPGRFHFGSTG